MALKAPFQLKPFYDIHVCGERTLILESKEGRGKKSCVNVCLMVVFFFNSFSACISYLLKYTALVDLGF